MAKSFTAQERAAAVARVAAGERPTAVARDFGVSVENLRRWRIALGHATSTGEREPDGRFRKGYTANPGGCTTHAERAQKMLEEAAPLAAQRLIELVERIVDEDDPEAVEVLAAKGHILHKLLGQILDRGIGKATQRVEVKESAAPPEIIVDLTPEKP
jgi:transposase-like protein